jgi:hypothetical protein
MVTVYGRKRRAPQRALLCWITWVVGVRISRLQPFCTNHEAVFQGQRLFIKRNEDNNGAYTCEISTAAEVNVTRPLVLLTPAIRFM